MPVLKLGCILQLKKNHPCGNNKWQVYRLGADVGLKCLGCGHMILIPKVKLEHKIVTVDEPT